MDEVQPMLAKPADIFTRILKHQKKESPVGQHPV